MDENLKQRIIGAVLAFNFTIIFFQLLFNSGRWFSYGKLVVAVALAGGVAGATYRYLEWKQSQDE